MSDKIDLFRLCSKCVGLPVLEELSCSQGKRATCAILFVYDFCSNRSSSSIVTQSEEKNVEHCNGADG